MEAIRAELIGQDCARANGILVTGHAAPVLRLCRALLKAGIDPATPLEAYRGAMLSLRVRSIGEGAALTVRDGPDGKPRFATFRPGPDGRESCGGQAQASFPAGSVPSPSGPALSHDPRPL
jgi:hypothetical protein